MFGYCNSVMPASAVCTQADFERIISSAVVKDNCEAIRHIVEGIQPDATEKQLKQAKDAIGKYKSGAKDEGIKSLPGFCFHASFSDGKRSNASAVASGLVSIDLDDVFPSPRQFFDELKDKAVAEHLALAYISPSTRGLKLVFPVPEGSTDIESAQEIIVERLGVGAYHDGKTFDLARLAFASPADYILYRDDSQLFSEHTLPKTWDKDEKADGTSDATCEGLSPQEKADKHFIDGISMADILVRICEKICGKAEPDAGQRNNTMYQATKLMRVYCDDNIEVLFEVMPRWGLPDAEWEQTIRSACKRPIAQSTRHEAESLLLQMRRDKAVENGEVAWRLPAPPKNLPPVFKEFARVTPTELLPAQLLALCPTLGFFGTMAKANYADPGEEDDWRAPNLITVIVAPPASGKDNITKVFKRLTKKLSDKELPLLEQLNKYNKTKKPEDLPAEGIRLLPERLSMTSLSVQMERAKGKHVFIFTPEIDTLKTSNGSGGWADLSTVFRKAIDNDTMGQIYMSADSHCTNVPVFLNMLILAQPERMHQFFNRDNIINGLVSRVLFVELPDNTGCRKLSVKKMSDFEQRNVEKVIHYLESIHEVLEEEEYDEEGNLIKGAVYARRELKMPRTRKALKAWGLEHQDHYLQTQENPAEDHFFRRSSLLGFHAAMVAYMCSGCKETKAVIDFALWVAEYCLQSQLLHFGAAYNEIAKRRSDSHIDRVLAMNSVSKFNLLAALPTEFTTQDMVDLMRKEGRTMANPSNTIRKWKLAGLVKELAQTGNSKKWKKT